MVQRYIVIASAWLEIVVGVIFIAAPDAPCVLLFDGKPEGIGMPLARWVGVSLLALGIACVPSKAAESHRTSVPGLFVLRRGWLSCSSGWASPLSTAFCFGLVPSCMPLSRSRCCRSFSRARVSGIQPPCSKMPPAGVSVSEGDRRQNYPWEIKV
jgi:hypothetical protein